MVTNIVKLFNLVILFCMWLRLWLRMPKAKCWRYVFLISREFLEFTPTKFSTGPIELSTLDSKQIDAMKLKITPLHFWLHSWYSRLVNHPHSIPFHSCYTLRLPDVKLETSPHNSNQPITLENMFFQSICNEYLMTTVIYIVCCFH